jgi:hypothetical protein
VLEARAGGQLQLVSPDTPRKGTPFLLEEGRFDMGHPFQIFDDTMKTAHFHNLQAADELVLSMFHRAG